MSCARSSGDTPGSSTREYPDDAYASIMMHITGDKSALLCHVVNHFHHGIFPRLHIFRLDMELDIKDEVTARHHYFPPSTPRPSYTFPSCLQTTRQNGHLTPMVLTPQRCKTCPKHLLRSSVPRFLWHAQYPVWGVGLGPSLLLSCLLGPPSLPCRRMLPHGGGRSALAARFAPGWALRPGGRWHGGRASWPPQSSSHQRSCRRCMFP